MGKPDLGGRSPRQMRQPGQSAEGGGNAGVAESGAEAGSRMGVNGVANGMQPLGPGDELARCAEA